MSDCDSQMIEIGWDKNDNPCQFVSAEFARKLERERDEAIRQRDETNESSKFSCNFNYEEKLKAERERDEVREKAERYRIEANAMMMQRDEWARLCGQYKQERDEAWEDSAHWKVEYEIVEARLCGWKHPRDNGIIFEHEIIPKLTQERDKAREDATNYYARIGELESERDNAPGRAERASI